VQNGVANEPTLGAALNTSSNGSSRAASHYLLEQWELLVQASSSQEIKGFFNNFQFSQSGL
jgi:hypothetical protein